MLKAIPSFLRRRKSGDHYESNHCDAPKLLASFEKAADGWFWETDPQGRLTYISDNIARWLPGGAHKALGCDFASLVQQPDLPSGIRRALPIMMSRQVDFERVNLRLLPSEKESWWSVSGFAQFDQTGRFRGYAGFALDVTEQQQAYDRATRLAMYDPLTGLPNRLSMARTLETVLADLDPASGSCAVLMLDLARFKQVNDTLGHPAGDTLLKQVAERILAIVGDENRVFRLGGDEFQIVMPKSDDRSALGHLAEKLIESLSQAYFIQGSRCVIGASVGIAIAPFDGSTSDELIRNADLALYAAKDSGRGLYRLFSNELLKAAEEKRLLEDDLRDALAKGEIFLTYQPVVNAADNRLTGVEALMRWEHPKHGMISPSKFIAIAEENGFVEQLGTWALRQACANAASWPSDLRVAVNVSPLQFCNPIFPEIVMSALSASGLPPQRLELEITEGVFLSESDETDTTFSRLKRIGVRLALDDFGTGYSSLGYLRSAPFDKIKIDQSFVRGATIKGSRNSAIITAIVALADALGMDTTAEGIETMDQLDLIRKLRVTHVQGFVYSKPLTCEDLLKRFETGAWVFTPSGPPRQRGNRYTVYRAAAAIHGNQYYPVLIRNLSESGALIEGMGEAPVGTRLLIDFGTGQLTLAVVRRVSLKQHGVEFEQPLVSDGGGGLCTRRRVSPHLLKSAGLPALEDSEAVRRWQEQPPASFDELRERLGLNATEIFAISADTGASETKGEKSGAAQAIPTFKELAERYIAHIRGRSRGHEMQLRYIDEHLLPAFGNRQINKVSGSDIDQWLAAKSRHEGFTPAAALRISSMVSYMFKLARRWDMPGAEPNPIPRPGEVRWRVDQRRVIATANLERLHEAASASANTQLRHIVTLLLETSMDLRDLLAAKWAEVDLDKGLWRIPLSIPGAVRELSLSEAARETIRKLPRWEGCPYLIANPRTRKPYRSLAQSWDSVRKKAGLSTLNIDDLRYLSAKDR